MIYPYPCEICGAGSEVLEYDNDEDFYVMLCENGHRWYYETDDEVWK